MYGEFPFPTDGIDGASVAPDHVLSGFFPFPSIGPFIFIPDPFAGLAIFVRFYRSQA